MSEEFIEFYTREKKPSGVVLPRSSGRWNEPGEGLYFPVVAIWLRDGHGRVLATRRSAAKSFCPGLWENPGGAVKAGETPEQAILRELEEETGFVLLPEEIVLLDEFYTEDGRMVLTYGAVYPRSAVRFQENENDAYAWVRPARVMAFCKNGHMAPPIAEQIVRYYPKLVEFAKK